MTVTVMQSHHTLEPINRKSSKSRTASPKKFKERITMKIAPPGKRLIHQASVNSIPVAIIRPQLGSGGWAPSPKKLKPDSIIRAWEAVSEPKTMTLPITFG